MPESNQELIERMGHLMGAAMADKQDADLTDLIAWKAVRQLTRWETWKCKVDRTWKIWFPCH